MQKQALNMSVIINNLIRYHISCDQRYGHNRDSCYIEEFGFWVYENKKGKWVKYDELNKFIYLLQINKYTVCNDYINENIYVNIPPFEYDFDVEGWVKLDNNGMWVKWTDVIGL